MKHTYIVSFIPLMFASMRGTDQSTSCDEHCLAYYSSGLQKMSPLHYAALNNQLDIVRLLVQKGDVVNDRNAFGMHPLHYAASTNATEVIEELLAQGASINGTDKNEKTALVYAVLATALPACELLLRNSAATEIKTVEGGMTALMYAAREGSLALTTLLVHFGADIWAMDYAGMRPIDYAISWGHREVADFLASQMEESYGRQRWIVQSLLPKVLPAVVLGASVVALYSLVNVVASCCRSLRYALRRMSE